MPEHRLHDVMTIHPSPELDQETTNRTTKIIHIYKDKTMHSVS